MSFIWQESRLFVELNALATLAIALLLYFLGQRLCRMFPLLNKYCIPAAIVGGTAFALFNLGNHYFNFVVLTFDDALQIPAMTGFFACAGLGVAKGGVRHSARGMGLYFLLCAILVVMQNIIALGLSLLFGIPPAVGLMAGSTSLVGGHGSAVSFGQSLQARGITDALDVGLAAATFGLISGSAIGGPLASLLIRRKGVNVPGKKNIAFGTGKSEPEAAAFLMNPSIFYKHVALVAIIMGLSSLCASLIESLLPNLIVPPSIAAMLLGLLGGVMIKRFAWTDFNGAHLDLVGDLLLMIFLTEASMSLRLWELFDLALPLLTILLLEVAFIAVFAYAVVYPALCKALDSKYEAAVTISGLCGHGLGAAPNAIANMDAIISRYGPAPNAYLIIPLVGGFLIDLVNIPLIFVLLNLVA